MVIGLLSYRVIGLNVVRRFIGNWQYAGPINWATTIRGYKMGGLYQGLGRVQNSQPYDVVVAQANDDSFVGDVRVIRRLGWVKVYIKNVGLRVIIKAGSFYDICLGHLTFLLNSLPYREIKKAVIINPSSPYSRYTTHRYFGFLGAISHHRNASSSSCHPSTMYAGSSMVLRNSSRYSARRENSGCSRRILFDQTFSVSLIDLPNFDVAIHNASIVIRKLYKAGAIDVKRNIVQGV